MEEWGVAEGKRNLPKILLSNGESGGIMKGKENGKMKLNSFDGKEIYVHEWLIENPRAVVQIVHGMAEHAGRYAQFAQFLNAHGFAVVADDHRGHGLTDGETLGYCKGNMFSDTVKDEWEINKYYKAKYPDAKYFLFGFSYGSFLAQSYISRFGERLDGAIIAGSSHKKDAEVYAGSFVVGMQNAFGRAKKPSKFVERLSFGAYEKKFDDRQWLSTNKASNKAYRADSLCGFTCSNRFYADFFKGLKSLYTKQYRSGLRKDLPVLLLSGENDPVGNMGKGVKKLYRFYTEKAGMKRVEMKLFPDSRHEFLNETDGREEKWSAPLRFFEANV